MLVGETIMRVRRKLRKKQRKRVVAKKRKRLKRVAIKVNVAARIVRGIATIMVVNALCQALF